jgi:hypothetical protein
LSKKVVEGLPSKLKVLSSNPKPPKKEDLLDLQGTKSNKDILMEPGALPRFPKLWETLGLDSHLDLMTAVPCLLLR